MNIETGNLNRRNVSLLVVGVAVILILRYGVYGDRSPEVTQSVETVTMAEQRLDKVRRLSALVPGKEAILKQANDDLAVREAGVLKADTAPQAQAQLLDIIHRVAAKNQIDARGAEELREARPLGNDYGEVSVTETFTCQIEQLVNFLADLANQPEILATNNLHVASTNDKKKSIQVRLSLSGVVARKLVPVKKAGAF